MIRAVIFDCDGVLFRSDAANVAFYNEVLRRVGEPPLVDEGEVACHALASAQLFERYYGDRPQLLARIRETAQSVDYTPFFEYMEPREGLYEVLRDLRRRYRTAMATNRGKTVRGVLERFALEGLFDVALGVLDVERPKPHPDLLLACAERFGIAPAEAVYVGDQPLDAQAAAAAGMPFIAMGPVIAEAPVRIDALTELPHALVRLSNGGP